MCKYTVHVTPHTHSSKVCVVSVREAVVFCPTRTRAQAARPPAAACLWSLPPIDVEWDQLHKNNSDKEYTALRGGPFPRSDQACSTNGGGMAKSSNPLQMNTIVSERDGLYNRELEDIELQELHKGQQRWEKDGKKIKKCISKYIKCMFYGPLTGAIFFVRIY